MIKADLPQLEALSRRLGVCSGDVDDLKANLTAVINTTTWEGGKATKFRGLWESEFRPALDDLSAALTEAGTNVNATMQNLDHAGN